MTQRVQLKHAVCRRGNLLEQNFHIWVSMRRFTSWFLCTFCCSVLAFHRQFNIWLRATKLKVDIISELRFTKSTSSFDASDDLSSTPLTSKLKKKNCH